MMFNAIIIADLIRIDWEEQQEKEHLAKESQESEHLKRIEQQQEKFLAKLDTEDRYIYQCHQILAAVVPENPNYRAQVSKILLEYVPALVGEENSSRVVEQIVDNCSVDDLREIMQNYDQLKFCAEKFKKVLQEDANAEQQA